MHGWDWNWNGEWNWDWSPALVVTMIIVGLVFLAVAILVEFLFLRNLRDLLKQVSDQNRAIPSSYVWLNFIPLFGLGWIIYTVIKVRDSVRAEYRTRGWAPRDDFAYGVGLAYGILTIASFALGAVPFVGGMISIASLVCWIVYWVKTSQLKRQLMQGMAPGGYAAPPQYPATQAPAAPAYGEQSPMRQTPGEEITSGESAAAGEAAAVAATCPFCGATYRPRARFCSVCGRPVT